MNVEITQKVQTKFMTGRPEIEVGDTVSVHTIIRDGDKKRIQRFEGLVISIKGSGTDKMFTVRKISYGIGVEKIFPLYSTNIEKIEVKKHASVKRSKLYYMRDRIGKSAMKLKAGKPVVVDETPKNYVKEAENAEAEVATDEKAEKLENDDTNKDAVTAETTNGKKTKVEEKVETKEASDEKKNETENKKEEKSPEKK